ncbi:response regulator [Litorivicinus lipolyticus]|uniref:Response regulator n=1 Tax=Litorivicinus lipolyticus TaxID=418701 RepID=A0A5Q2Q800_9GAMM|nr:chemotaxis protein CheV [Litorivicinus lipolyticus]QGG80208.1 response regulator [Litorivicinus lipolyticus]
MSGLFERVDAKTDYVGQNRVELLLFRLADEQVYGINVFKVKEVLRCPKLATIPNGSPRLKGIAHLRGEAIPVIDMAAATGFGELQDIEERYIIITEYNSQVQGFLVHSVERIINTTWDKIKAPDAVLAKDSYLTAMTEDNGRLVEIIDVERILSELDYGGAEVSETLVQEALRANVGGNRVLIVDDSLVARKQIQRALESLGIETTMLTNGQEALDLLKKMVAAGRRPADHYLMIVTDIEMPILDGYTLTAEIKSDPMIQDLYVLMHSSLSGAFNEAMALKVGADKLVAKFKPDSLAEAVMDQIALRS